ncbi:unnamed protein product [Clonostachys rhizophaga]|uniref:Uncharacterized protein n=1 Tax=Clonostachys rhizophaga TaxID=160324 RepID=A0A9N9YM01_9HYPO|nr:unnamed protein product [Clonostachys rhizophaga]
MYHQIANQISTRASGNEVAAQDLYGLGVRLGIYLQAIGMCLSVLRLQANSFKITCSGLMVAILVCWTRLVVEKEISPAEAFLIILLTSVLSYPALSSILCPNALVGESLGIITTCVANIWHGIALIVFWAVLYNKLPALGTPNKVFLFASWRMDGGFRIFALIFSVINFNVIMGTVAMSAILLRMSFLNWKYETNDSLGYRWTGRFEGAARISAAASIIPIVIFIVSIEMDIKANDLTPTQQLSQPGQALPLAIGAITFLDCFLALVGTPNDDDGLEWVKDKMYDISLRW